MMIFTSGTSGEPKAVQVTNSMLLFAGTALVERFGLKPEDTCYLSMPLFHSNALVGGWAPALGAGAAMVPAKFSASGFLADIRRYGATYMNYVGKPLAYVLATPEQPDDADNPLRVAFGNEATDRDIEEFGRRFGCERRRRIRLDRERGDHHQDTRHCPTGSIGKGFPGVAIYDRDTVTECAVARVRRERRLGQRRRGDRRTGEHRRQRASSRATTTTEAATDERMRHGMYWSGDLAYRDADGWIYLAGRTADWMRVDGENLTTAPIERILLRLPAINRVAVYPVPDEYVGDQVMAAIVLRDDADADPRGVRGVPGRAARPVAEGLAAPRVDRRRPAQHRDQQDPQARAGRPRRRARRPGAVETRRHALRQRRRRYGIARTAHAFRPLAVELA